MSCGCRRFINNIVVLKQRDWCSFWYSLSKYKTLLLNWQVFHTLAVELEWKRHCDDNGLLFRVVEWEWNGDRQDILYTHIRSLGSIIQGVLTRPAVCYSGSPTSLNSHPLSDSSNMCQNVPVNRDYSVIKPTSWVQIDKQPSLKLLLCCKRKANQIQVWIANRFIATWIWIEMLSNKVMKIRCKIGCTNRLRISYRWIRTLHISFLYILVFSILDTLNNL